MPVAKLLKSIGQKASRSTIRGAQRKAFPRIYDDPRVIAQRAAAYSAPESGAMKELFGVSRDDLYELTKSTRGLGGEPAFIPPLKARGSEAAEQVMGKANTQRLVNTLIESSNYPEIYKGMDAWYNMDPVYKRYVEIYGPEEGAKKFKQFNALTGMASPGSSVPVEINRGTAANWLATQGRFDDFSTYAGRGEGQYRPEDLREIKGHPYHSTAQVPAMQNYLETGEVMMKEPKVKTYISALLPEELGGSWRVPVGDAHFSRGIGLADTRNIRTVKGKEKIPDASISNPELGTITDWWAKISDEVGLTPVEAQARLWGTLGHATGVDSPIGSSKLEILANQIMDQSRRRGIDPKLFRDYVLSGGDIKALGISASTAALLLGMPAFAEEEVRDPKKYIDKEIGPETFGG